MPGGGGNEPFPTQGGALWASDARHESAVTTHPPARASAGSARASSAPTGFRRRPASSPTRVTSGRPGCSGGTRCAARTPTRASSRSTSPRRSRCPASTPCSRTRTFPGQKRYGLEFPDQPVLAIDRVRYFGEPVALVAAEHPEQARRAAEKIRVEYEPLEPSSTRERATEQEPLHPDRPTMGHGYRDDPRPNVVRHLVIRHGDPDAKAEVAVEGVYELGHPGPGVSRPRVGPRGPGRRGRRRHLRRHAVAARRPRPGRAVPRPPARAGAHPPGRSRRRVRRPRRPLDADPRRDARPAHRPAREARLRSRGVVRRPRPPPSGQDLGRASRRPRRTARLRPDARSCSTAAPTPPRRRR